MRIIILCLLPLFAFSATPPQAIDLDLSQTARAFKIQTAQGTTPMIRANVKNAGAAYTVTGWTATLYLQATWDDTSVIVIPSTTTGATFFDFQATGTQTSTNGIFRANIIATDGSSTVEWQRGEVEIRQSPGTAGAGTINLSTPLSWSGYQYSGTGGSGPYRAGSNVVFTVNGDGSANINASDTLGALTPTAGRIIYGNGTAWATLATGSTGQVLTAQGSAPPIWSSAGAGDITSVAVAGDMMSGGGTTGDITITGPSTNAVRAAVSGIYLPLATGGTLSGDVEMANGAGSSYALGFRDFANGLHVLRCDSAGVLTYDGYTVWNSNNDGTGSTMEADTLDGYDSAAFAPSSLATNLNASALTYGTIPDARFPATLPAKSGVNLTNLNASNLASGTVSDSLLSTSSRTVSVPVSAWKGPLDTEIPGWAYKSFATTNTTTTVCEGLVNYETTQRTATIDANFKTPAEATAWKTTGAIVLQFFGDSTTTSEVCYRVYVYRDGTSAAIYDTGATQALASTTGVTTISIPASSLGTFSAGTGYTIRVQPSVKFATTAKGFYFHNVTVQVVK